MGVGGQVRLTKEEYRLPGPDVMIYFTSDYDIQKAGFKAIYIITPSTEVNAPEGGMCQLQWRSWQTHWILIKMAGTLHKIFLVAFNKQVLCMNRYFAKVCSRYFKWKYTNIEAESGFVLHRVSTITLTYRITSNIRRTESQNLNDSRVVLQLALPNPLKPGIKSIMKM